MEYNKKNLLCIIYLVLFTMTIGYAEGDEIKKKKKMTNINKEEIKSFEHNRRIIGKRVMQIPKGNQLNWIPGNNKLCNIACWDAGYAGGIPQSKYSESEYSCRVKTNEQVYVAGWTYDDYHPGPKGGCSYPIGHGHQVGNYECLCHKKLQ